MVELKPVSGKAAIRALERLGFARVRQRGSHVILKKMPEGETGCAVPLHKELAVGTLKGILKQAGVSPEDFMDNL
jgi:predicted RNA binding protein YcfA (HicA-like mRNA interferase family)